MLPSGRRLRCINLISINKELPVNMYTEVNLHFLAFQAPDVGVLVTKDCKKQNYQELFGGIS